MGTTTGGQTRFPWEGSYPRDVDWHATIPVAPLHQLIDDAAARFGAKPAIDFFDRITPYSELKALCDRAARGLQRIGVGPGIKVGLLLPNCPAFVIFYYGILKAGGTVVNLNPLYAERELESLIEDSEADVLITLDLKAIYGKAERLRVGTRLKHLVICPLAEQLPFPKSLLFRLAKRREIARIHYDETRHAMRRLLANDGRYERKPCDPARDAAVLQYTGGTTGLPKAAMLSHANAYANAQQCLLYFPQTVPGQEVMMGVLPFFHVFAMTVCLNFSVLTGAKMVLLPRFELGALVKGITRKKPTFLSAVPTIYIALNGHPDIIAGKCDLRSIKVCTSGGAALPHEVQEVFERQTGCPIIEGYGLSETAPVAICNPSTGVRRPGSLGLPMPGTIVEIVSTEEPERLLPQGERGEICLRGPQVMLGYWKRPEDTAHAFAGGRFHTGDVGYIDADGYTFLIDRLKEIILCGGYSVFPRHVEEAIYQHPAVKEVTVIGIPDPYRQQAVKAFIKLAEGRQLDANTLKAFLADRLSPIEMPKEIEFRAELPKTPIGKLSKKELIAEEVAKAAAGAGKA